MAAAQCNIITELLPPDAGPYAPSAGARSSRQCAAVEFLGSPNSMYRIVAHRTIEVVGNWGIQRRSLALTGAEYHIRVIPRHPRDTSVTPGAAVGGPGRAQCDGGRRCCLVSVDFFNAIDEYV